MINHFNTEKVTTMGEMFYVNHALKTIDLTHFKIPKVTSVSYMLSNCTSLESAK